MRLSDILSSDRITIDTEEELGLKTKADVVAELARLLCFETDIDPRVVQTQLMEREKLQSTGVGEGVAIPHTSLDAAPQQRAALVLSRAGVDFDAIDGNPAHIFFGVIGPKRAASEHLKILAKVSRLLKSPETRRRLLESGSPQQAYSLVEEREAPATKP